MSTRPDIEIALDIRSYEKVVAISPHDSNDQYPETWLKPNSPDELGIDSETVVVVDKVDLQNSTLSKIAESNPRLVAFVVADVDHEKHVRRMVTTLFPWNEIWTLFTSFGKLLVTKDVKGKAYEYGEVTEEGLVA